MSTPSRTRPGASMFGTPLRGEVFLSGEELAAAVGISPARLARLIRLGLVEPATLGASEFTAATAARLGRMLRLRADLDLHLVDAAIIVDLLERLDRLEAELARRQTTSAK